MNIQILKDQLIKHEGLRLKPYLDSVGKMTIGVGRNLDDVGITEAEAMKMLENDILRTASELNKAFYWFDSMDDVRGSIVMDMCFNLGITRFRGFKKMIQAIENNDWIKASEEMKDSKWCRQVGIRCTVLSQRMRDGI
mgnify:CR=1 FL=1